MRTDWTVYVMSLNPALQVPHICVCQIWTYFKSVCWLWTNIKYGVECCCDVQPNVSLMCVLPLPTLKQGSEHSHVNSSTRLSPSPISFQRTVETLLLSEPKVRLNWWATCLWQSQRLSSMSRCKRNPGTVLCKSLRRMWS